MLDVTWRMSFRWHLLKVLVAMPLLLVAMPVLPVGKVWKVWKVLQCFLKVVPPLILRG